MKETNYGNEKRKFEVYSNGNWNSTPFSELKKGDMIRGFEPTGERVMDDEGISWICVSDPYKNDKDVWTISVEVYRGK